MVNATYPNGVSGHAMRVENRQSPFLSGTEFFPAPDTNFEELIGNILPQTAKPKGEPDRTNFEEKLHQLLHDFSGQSELALLCGCLIAILRRDPVPPAMMVLWNRLWDECSEALCLLLRPRWKIAALQTFADHGQTELERRAASDIVLFANMIKIYESERQFSGLPATKPFAFGKRNKTQIAFGLPTYTILNGDLDRNILGRLWAQAESAGGGCGAIATSLLDDLNEDNANVFHRLIVMRERMVHRNKAED